jgi:hypothetical protein
MLLPSVDIYAFVEIYGFDDTAARQQFCEDLHSDP